MTESQKVCVEDTLNISQSTPLSSPLTVGLASVSSEQTEQSEAAAGSADPRYTCVITLRFRNFAQFWHENPRIARFALQAESRALLPKERVRNCLRTRISKDEPIEGLYNQTVSRGHFANLQTCGSVWFCPVCAAKVTTRKREELSEATEIWTAKGNSILLATFTLQHLATDRCSEVLEGITKSFSRFWRDRAGQKIRSEYRIFGRVRGLETTYTIVNAWHIHFHTLFFIKGSISPSFVDLLREDCILHWQNVLSRHKRFADGVHGVVIEAREKEISDYIAKQGKENMLDEELQEKVEVWTEAHEVALGTVKRASKGGFTPMQLLALSLCGDEKAGRIFAEYALCFKGKRQVLWSKGLRESLGLKKEKTDEEIAAEEKEVGSRTLVELRTDHWKVILGNAIRGELLKALDTGDSWRVLEFLESYGIKDAYLPELVNDENYFGPHRVYSSPDESIAMKGYIDNGRIPPGLDIERLSTEKRGVPKWPNLPDNDE